jgi:outer membrane protein assembly factor BamB
VVRELPTDGPVRGAVAVTVTGNVIVPSEDGSIYAFDAHGTLLWKTKTTSAIDSSPAFGLTGEVVVGSRDGSVYCFR